ncbi:membrane protein [Sphaerisporangium krabiense]|uniref:Uncharacterized membrane protein YoaK (UPF0700 family) n=1 Tax=Sphaerisporangium krabiense TaxID=763782 RepID=A0A7W8ZD16_9ACTN|nr:YoaK family protein [Sphaerisporangium krabiense]MBB5631706.1 uncharacterized membrane protein YoaK (UPF0700 family) [Sphaerisporangium krabiense]GII60657.1 membrane protein [Sphaerisporangium krabiense]
MTAQARRQDRDPLPPALVALTVVSGCVDAVSLLALGHVFTANMTGNVVILGLATAGAPGFSVAASLTSLVAYMAGALAAGRAGARVGSRRARILLSLAAETVLVALAAGVSARWPAVTGGGYHPVVALTAVAMGAQFATVRTLAIPDLTTTIQTRNLTGLAADAWTAGDRVLRRAASVLSLMSGAVAGALLLRFLGAPRTLACVAGGVVLIAVVYAVRSRAGRRSPGGR